MTTILRHALSPAAAATLAEIRAMANLYDTPVDVAADDPSAIAELVGLGYLARYGNSVEVLRP
jgi:hypothetical protein